MIQSFTFCVLAYNHSGYIVEHLESIKYQIINYGGFVNCALILSDDASTDDTIFLVDGWLKKNESVFSEVTKIHNTKNQGTCKSLINIAQALNTKYFKITAGDDIYSCENIFAFCGGGDFRGMKSGIPIRIIDGKVTSSFFEVINFLASDRIYKNKSLIHRLSNLSIINAPNLFYSSIHIKNKKILSFLEGFDVVEDWPLQISIASFDDNVKLISEATPAVFYRRTSGSTYIVASERFLKDQVNVFDHLISYHEARRNWLQAVLLKNRRFLFVRNSRVWGLLNLSKYIYFFKFLIVLPFLILDYKKLNFDIPKYQKYCDELVRSSK